jgi:hypothetical protein
VNPLLETEISGAPVIITLAGKSYRLAYPIAAVIAYKQRTGDNLFQPESWNRISPGEDPERFLACLWAGLRTHHPELTEQQLSGLVDFSNAVELTLAVTRALVSCFPRAKEEDEGAEQKGEPDPNLPAPETPAQPTPESARPAELFLSSGPPPAAISDSLTKSF